MLAGDPAQQVAVTHHRDFYKPPKTREKESTEAHARNKSDERVAVVVKLVSVLIK